MTIEARQRSPLGAYFRSPLGAFGPGAVVSAPIEWSGVVAFDFSGLHENPPFSTFGLQYLDSPGTEGCASSKWLRDDDWPYTTRQLLEFDLTFTGVGSPNMDEDADDWHQWRVTGNTSGAVYNVGLITQTLNCQARSPGIADDSESYWSTEGANPSGTFRPRYSEGLFINKGADTATLRRWANDFSVAGFINGESITITRQ